MLVLISTFLAPTFSSSTVDAWRNCREILSTPRPSAVESTPGPTPPGPTPLVSLSQAPILTPIIPEPSVADPFTSSVPQSQKTPAGSSSVNVTGNVVTSAPTSLLKSTSTTSPSSPLQTTGTSSHPRSKIPPGEAATYGVVLFALLLFEVVLWIKYRKEFLQWMKGLDIRGNRHASEPNSYEPVNVLTNDEPSHPMRVVAEQPSNVLINDEGSSQHAGLISDSNNRK